MKLSKKIFTGFGGAVSGAAFLMASSAIGPGFLTQTAKFTEELKASFGFIIIISILLDIAVQLNIWRIIAVSELRVQDIANRVTPGLGYFIAALIALGGLVFNIGNMGGCGMGLQILTGIEPGAGALISAVIALAIFWYREAGKLMDSIVKVLGFGMIALTVYVVYTSRPPVNEAIYRSVWPEATDVMKIITLVGGTVGGYISFAGAHRLLDAGIKGKNALGVVNKSAVSGILVTSLMRYILFLAALGVVWQGAALGNENPAGEVFHLAAGKPGHIFFGIVLWSAAITSVIGASYTSVSFWKTLHPFVRNNEKIIITVFILISTAIFGFAGNPVTLLIVAGAFNGIILPISLAVILIAASRRTVMGEYYHPFWMRMTGWIVVIIMSWMSIITIKENITTFLHR